MLLLPHLTASHSLFNCSLRYKTKNLNNFWNMKTKSSASGKNWFFIHTQGFERRFFERNFTKYFGETVRWEQAVEWATGKEGYEVHVQMHPQMREEILTRMRRDAKWAFNRAIVDKRDDYRALNPAVPTRNRSVSATREPPVDQFLIPEFLDDGRRNRHDGRLSRSAPASPSITSATITHPGILSPKSFLDDSCNDLYGDPKEYEYAYTSKRFEVPTVVLQKAPSLGPTRKLRPAKSDSLMIGYSALGPDMPHITSL